MNELEILRGQLESELRHFAAVKCACSETLRRARVDEQAFVRACQRYLAFAAERLGGPAEPTLTEASCSAQAAECASADEWRRFVASLERQLEARQSTIRAARERGASIAEWRALARVDADSIMREREQYQHLRLMRPGDLTTELP